MKIPVYRSQIEVPDATRGLSRLDTRALTAPGAGLVNLGAAAMDAAEIIRRSDEHAAAQEAGRAAAAARSDWLTRADKMRGEAEEGAPEFTDRVMEEFDRDKQQRLEAASPLARPYLESALSKIRFGLKKDSMSFESGARLKKQLRDLDTTLNTETNSVRADEMVFSDALANGIAAISASQMDANTKAQARSTFERNLARAVFQGAIERDPVDARKRLEAGEFKSILQENDFHILLNQAGARVEHLRALEAAEVKSLARDHIASIQETGEGLKGVVERAKASFTPAAYAELLKDERFARDYHAASQGMNFAAPDAIAATVAQFKPAPGSEGYADRLRLYEGLVRRADQILKFREKDPAGYAMTSPDMRAAFERAASDPATYERALATRIEFQKQFGSPPKVLSEAEAKDTVARVIALPAAEQAAVGAQLMAGYGVLAPKALAELAGAGLPAGHQVLHTLAGDPVAAAKMATALGIGHKELVKGIETEELKNVRETVAGSLRSFRRAFEGADPSGGAARAFNGIVSAIEDLALIDVRAGASPSAAAEAAVDTVVGKRYHVIDTAMQWGPDAARIRAYMPKWIGGTAIDPDAVHRAALAKLNEKEIRAFDPEPFGDPNADDELSRERTVRTALNSGFWTTDATGEGMVLMVPFRGAAALPLLNKNRRPYRLDFVEATNRYFGLIESLESISPLESSSGGN